RRQSGEAPNLERVGRVRDHEIEEPLIGPTAWVRDDDVEGHYPVAAFSGAANPPFRAADSISGIAVCALGYLPGEATIRLELPAFPIPAPIRQQLPCQCLRLPGRRKLKRVVLPDTRLRKEGT